MALDEMPAIHIHILWPLVVDLIDRVCVCHNKHTNTHIPLFSPL